MSEFFKAISYRTYIEAPPEKVFTTLTTREGWDSWFTDGMELDLATRIIRFRWVNFGADRITATDGGEIKEYVPNQRFSFTWHTGSLDEPTLVSFRLEEKSGGTLLTVTDEGYPRTKRGETWLLDCSAGWAEAITLLKVFLEIGYRYRIY
jgi:uncharacterized protein YndB with AHSA1/START domain